ncbi:thioredoxin domain-containing protein, partial [candidate division KSB1 bacterium]|nr:thioredoxin domain-containing protein [candidate division KSB1 bacterium]
MSQEQATEANGEGGRKPIPSPEELKKLPRDGGPEFNRLVFEKSPYLLQHAANPVNWYPWGEEAFETARKEDKPIFLSIGYSTCHWCHVMERESFEVEEVAVLMNADFVAIKVDREERPDLDEIYMTAVQMMTGGGGGWPMSTFLTPEGKPFFGGTYFPRQQFSELLRRVHEVWSDPDLHQSVLEEADRFARR